MKSDILQRDAFPIMLETRVLKSKHPMEAWEFLNYLTLTEQDNAVKLAQYSLTTSESVAKAVYQDTDPVKSIFTDEINYAVKPSGYINPLLFEAWNQQLNVQFQNLLHVDDKDIPARLHDLSLKLDQEMNRLKISEEQTTASP